MIWRRRDDREPRERPQDQKDNLATWSVNIGTLLWVVQFLGAAYTRQPWAGLLIALGALVYIILLTIPGHINMIRILWGETVDESKPGVNTRLIVQATVGAGIVAIGVFVYDMFMSAASWGWFSWIGALIAAGYLALVFRDRNRQEELK